MTHKQNLKAAFDLIQDATEKYLRGDLEFREYQTVVTATALAMGQKPKVIPK